MSILQIVTRERNPIAEIHWDGPNQIKWHVFEPSYEADVKTFVEQAQEEGVPFRKISQIEQDGETTIAQEQLTIKADNDRFLLALADRVRKYRFAGQRLFGTFQEKLAKEEEAQS